MKEYKRRLMDKDELISFIKVNGFVYANTLETFQEVDPERHGHWIPTDKTDYGAPVFKCSACGGEDSEIKGDFCCWCGARMDEKEPQT